jgi:hypothetical protein
MREADVMPELVHHRAEVVEVGVFGNAAVENKEGVGDRALAADDF